LRALNGQVRDHFPDLRSPLKPRTGNTHIKRLGSQPL
jgi:hypothetical protein